jgi:hypothetical protein
MRTGHVDVGAFQAARAVSFRLVAPAQVLAGQPFTLTVVARDAQGNVASTFADAYPFRGEGDRRTERDRVSSKSRGAGLGRSSSPENRIAGRPRGTRGAPLSGVVREANSPTS